MDDAEKSVKNFLKQNEEVTSPPEAKVGILLVNTGTPQRFTYWSVRSYLSQFLSDRRVIEIWRIIWWPILYLIILTLRPFTKGAHYKSIWNWERDEAPLRTTSRNQATLLAKRFKHSQVEVEWAFRYGGPSVKSKIETLKKNGCDRLLLLPLYPQYSAVSTATVVDEAFRTLLTQRHQMALRTIPAFYSEECYINAIASSIEKSVSTARLSPQVIVVTYHGIPLSYQMRGDPYGFQCHHTTRLIQKKLKMHCEMITAFQSRFGNDEWLRPYTEEVIVCLARNGVQRIAVVAPGFMCDCLETINELQKDTAQQFLENGGKQFVYVHCLNDSAEGIEVIETITRKHLSGFLPSV